MREWGGLEMGENTASAYVDDRLRGRHEGVPLEVAHGPLEDEARKTKSSFLQLSFPPMTQTEGVGGGNMVQFTVSLLPLPFWNKTSPIFFSASSPNLTYVSDPHS